MPYHAVPHCAVPCHDILYHAMPCRAVPGRVAVENQTTRSQAALRQQYEERQRESEHVYELLENKIQLLQEVSPGAVGVRGIQGLMSGGSPHCHAGGQAGTERGRAGHGAGQSRGRAVPGADREAEGSCKDEGGGQEQ